MKVHEIHNDRELYEAVRDYTSKVLHWGGYADDDYDHEPAPDELIALLEERIAWVKAHKEAVECYLNRRSGPHWVRVIDGAKADASDRSNG